MKKTFYLFIALAFFCSNLVSQQDPMLSQYIFNGLYLNPGYAGSNDHPNLTLIHRNQWVALDGAPKTNFARLDVPFKDRNIGMGVIFMNDNIGVTQQNRVNLNTAYHLKMSTGTLSFGLKAGVTFFNSRVNELTVWDANDPTYEDGIIATTQPNVGFGSYYYAANWYAGLAIPQLISYEPNAFLSANNNSVFQTRRHAYLNGGYIFEIDEDLVLKPSVLLKYVKTTPLEADINLNILLKQLIWLGGSYRTGDSFSALLNIQVSKQFMIGYSHDFTTTRLKTVSNGTHEVIISYDFGKEALKMKTPRYF